MREGKELSCLVCSPAADYCLLSLMWLKWRWRRNRPSKNTPPTHALTSTHVYTSAPCWLRPDRGGGQVVITPPYIPATRNDRLQDGELSRCK